MRDASENNHAWRKSIDEISQNNAIWLYHPDFMLIINLNAFFGYFIDFLEMHIELLRDGVILL